MALIRLQKFLADNGVASRRKAEQFILDGRVKVNNKIVTELGTKVEPGQDMVSFDGKEIESIKRKTVLLLNKPTGYTCTTRKFKNEDNVLDLIDSDERIYPVGRLDKDSSGLLILTNDGDLAQKLTHPSYQKEKEYEVEVNKIIDDKFVNEMQKGIQLDEGKTLPAKVKKLNKKKFSIVIKEGKKRQIRRMCGSLDYRVMTLKRTRINQFKLDRIGLGKYRVLNKKEIDQLIK